MADNWRNVAPVDMPEERSPSWRDVAPVQQQEDVFTRLRRMPAFNELLGVQRSLQVAFVDPSAGDTNELRDRLEQLREQLIQDTGINPSTFDEFVRQESKMAVDIPELPAAVRVAGKQAGNVFGAAMGVIGDPLALAGDAVRTFTSNLAEVQGERVGVPPEQLSEFTGEPASNPITAIMDMSKAAWRTGEQLNLVDEPLITRDEAGQRQFNPENGWVVYAPDLVWDRYRRGVSAYEANLATTGRDLNARFKIDERLGVESEMGKELLGLGTELITDPWLWADFVFAGGKALRATGSLLKNEGIINSGRALERVGEQVYQTLSPVGLAKAAVGAVKAEPTGILNTVVDAIGVGVRDAVNGILDIEVPAAVGMLSKQRTSAAGVIGWQEGQLPAPRIRDLFFQAGRVENLEGGPLEILAGGERAGLSAGELALGTQRVVQSIAARGARDVADALTRGLTKKMPFRAPWMRLSVPTANQLTPEGANFVRSMGAIVSDFVRSKGVLPKNQIPTEYSRRLRAVADLYNQPYEDVVARFREAAGAARRVTLEAGHEVSGYRYFSQAMRNVADRMGVDYGDLRRAYERFVGNTDVQAMELEDVFTLAPAGTTGAVAPTPRSARSARDIIDGWIADPPSFNRLEQQIQDELGALGRADLRAITPSSYLMGIRNGYLPRMFNLIENPAAAYNALNDRSVVTVSRLDPKNLAKQMAQAFGSSVEGDVRRFFTARASGRGDAPPALVFRADDLANIVSKRLGREVAPSEIADVVYANDDNVKFLQETLQLLQRPAGSAPRGAGAGGAPWAMTPSAFAARQEFDSQDLARRVMIQDPIREVAEVGLRAGGQVRAQVFLGQVADNLRRLGLVVDPKDVPGGVNPEGVEYIFPFRDAEGAEMVLIPNRPQVWGDLANTAIPADVARLVTYSANFGQTSRPALQRMISMWRSALLSPASTAIRNVVSTFLLIQRAGGDLTDMITILPEASRIRRYFLETGRLPDELRGLEQYLGSFTQDSTKASTALRSMDAVLDDLARGGDTAKNRLNGLLDNAERFVQWGVESPVAAAATLGGTGFMGLFRWGEETTRLTSFISVFRRLVADGMKREEAASRAAHFASNAAFNYGAAPIIPDFLRRTGLSAFPQFSWFALSRTARAAAERPATIQRVEYARQAANIVAFEGDLDEQERVTAMSEDWLRYSKPLAIPIPGQDGRYYVFNMQYWLPDGDFLGTVLEPAEGGVFGAVADAVAAWVSGTGTGPFGAKFGLQVFDPSASAGQQALQTGQFLAEQYVFPGVFRQVERITEAVEYNNNKELFDLWGLETGKFFNSDWPQVFGQAVGVSARKVSVNMHDPSVRRRIENINVNYGRKIGPLNARMKQAAIFSEEYMEIAEEIRRLELERNQKVNELIRMAR